MAAEESPIVSVVIPCYNQAHFLSEAIESVFSQTYPHFELVVVDDGSTDNTSKVASRYPGVRCIRQENQGLAGARNTGIRRSNGSHLVFLDADDRLLPEALEVGLEHLNAHPECAFVSGHCTLIAQDGSPLGTPQQFHIERDHFLALLRGNYIWNPATVVYRRAIFEAVGDFETTVSPAADYDLYFRVAREFPVYCHAKVVAEYRRHDTNMTDNSALMLESVLTVLRSQWEYVKGSKQCEEAYKRGVEHYRDKYGYSTLIKEEYAHWRSEATTCASEALSEHRLVLDQTILERFRPSTPKVAGRPEATKNSASRKKLLALGIYLANVRSNVDDIVAALSDSSNYDVDQRWVAYGGEPPTKRVDDVTREAIFEKRPEFRVVNDLLTEEDLARYEYILVMGDDVVLPRHFLDQFVALQADLTFSIAQPAQTSNSYIDQPMLEQQRGVIARQTLFVGKGPVVSFHNSIYDLVFPLDLANPIGWEYENVWFCPLAERNLKMGLIDAIPVDHSVRSPATSHGQGVADRESAAFAERLSHFPYEQAFTVLDAMTFPPRREKEVPQQ